MNVNLPPFTCSHTPEFPELLAQLNCSLLISTFQANKVLAIGSDGEKLSQLARTFDRPMGMALQNELLAVATHRDILMLANDPRLAATYPNKPNFYDALFVPRTTHFCGQLALHDLVWTHQGLVGVNTLFSCLMHLDSRVSFRPVWQPSYISELEPEDRCHLNGVCAVDGELKYATAFSQTDTYEGWRADKLNSGVLLDVETGDVVVGNLPMPHSPRVFDGEVFVLLSALGGIARVDVEAGTYDEVVRLPGFVRGMAKCGDYLFVATSHLRKTHKFGDTPMAQDGGTMCGVTVIYVPTGAVVGQMKYENSVEEIFDIVVLEGTQRPGILGLHSDMYQRALSTPETTYWGEADPEN